MNPLSFEALFDETTLPTCLMERTWEGELEMVGFEFDETPLLWLGDQFVDNAFGEWLTVVALDRAFEGIDYDWDVTLRTPQGTVRAQRYFQIVDLLNAGTYSRG